MRKILLALLVMAGAVSLKAQNPNVPTIPTTTAPSGSCSGSQVRYLTPNGTLYTCQSGTWAASGGGGGLGPVTLTGTPAAGNLIVATSPTAATWQAPAGGVFATFTYVSGTTWTCTTSGGTGTNSCSVTSSGTWTGATGTYVLLTVTDNLNTSPKSILCQDGTATIANGCGSASGSLSYVAFGYSANVTYVGFTLGSFPSGTLVVASGNNMGPTGVAGPGYIATSSTSQTIGTGAMTFTTQSGLAYTAGSLSYVTICSAGTPTACLSGTITSYSGTSLVVNITATSGSGTYTDWAISAAGAAGLNGAGTVNSVTVTPPTQFSGTGCTITTSGTCVLAFPTLPNNYTADANSPYVQNMSIRRTSLAMATGNSLISAVGMTLSATGSNVADVPTSTAPYMVHIAVANGSAVGDLEPSTPNRTGRTRGISLECMGANTVITAIRSIPCGLTSTTLANSLGLDVPGAFSMAYIVFSTTGVYTSGTDTTHYMLCTVNGTTQNCVSTGVLFDTSAHRFRLFEDVANTRWTGCVDGTCVNNGTNNPASGTNLGVVLGSYGIGAASGNWQFAYAQLVQDLR